MPKTDTRNVFEGFTNLYELSKTLRFELKPIGKTADLLRKNKVFEKDEKVAKNYKETKKYFDKLHQKFINEALKSANIDLNKYREYEQVFFAYKKEKNKKNWIIVEGAAKNLRKKILAQFVQTADKWRNNYILNIKDEGKKKKIKKLGGLDLLFKVEVFDFLRSKYPEAIIDEKSIFDSFNKFSTYFRGFHQTRQNFYKDDGTSTAIPTRIVNDNLPKFLENKEVFENKYKGKCDNLFSEYEKQIFDLAYFNQCFSQEQIEKYNDTIAILKSKINKYRQDHSDKRSDNYIPKSNLPFFKRLFKQILGKETKKETEQSDFIEISGDKEVFNVLQDFIHENEKQFPKAKELFEKFVNAQKGNNDKFDTGKIYIAGRFITQISNKWFSDWNTIRSLFIEKKKKKIDEFIPMGVLKEKMQSVKIDKKDFFREAYKNIYEKSNDYYQIFLEIWEQEFAKNIETYKAELYIVQRMIDKDKEFKNKKGKLRNGEDGEVQKETIKYYADAALSIYQMMKYFSLEKGKERNWNPEGLEEDTEFYNDFGEYYENANIWKYFNEFRNYLTQKQYNEDKIKLNFENGTLLDGWDKNKETDNFGVILKKDGKYFLGLMHKNYNNIFGESNKNIIEKDIENGYYEKMVYKQMADPKKDFPKGIFSDKGIKSYKPPKEILEIYNTESFKNGTNFSVEKMRAIIDFYKECIPQHPSWKLFDFVHIKPTKEYKKNIGEFYDDVKKNNWKIWFEKVSEKYVNERLEKGELYLFEIYNKDFSQKADGNKKLHTLYWKEIFSDKNGKNPIFKLNGQAEIFFRKATENLEKTDIKTKKGVTINDKKGDNPYHLKRYTKNKILFHCPIKLNFAREQVNENNKKAHIKKFNLKTKEYLVGNKDINVIGIDRGEKHLAYYSIADQKGNILEMNSLNIVKTKMGEVDYHEILDRLEKERDAQRKSWQSIAKIKDMKRGYVSQVVKKICDLMIKYNAIVIFEDLNVGFKRGRFAVEKQVYQNLELALAKKLNYLVCKDKNDTKYGHHTKAFQLTPKIDNFQDIYKQCGMMFYIPASYTSAICPACGFRKNIPTPTETKEKNKEFVEKFKIFYEMENDRFSFEYQRNILVEENGKKKDENKNSGFKLFLNQKLPNDFLFYSDVGRLQFERNKDNRSGEIKWRSPNEKLKEIFKSNNIKIADDINIQIKNGNFDNKNFYEPFIWQIRLILQLRNSITVKDEKGNVNKKESHDFIQCPACHFHSETDLKGLDIKYKGSEKLDFNGDANGAYNIARKGSLILQKITEYKKQFNDLSKMENQDITITQDEWDKFVQQK